jgi:hypothetical protein
MCCVVPPAAADDKPAFVIPKSWEKVYAGPAPGLALSVRGGYAVGIGKVLVPHTREFRAQSFTETLYRFKAGDTEPEKLDERVTTHGLVALLGPGGEVAAGWFANCDTIYIPGLKPIPLPKDAQYAAHHFTREGLVCTAERFVNPKHERAVVLLPIHRGQNALGDVRVLRPWFADPAADGFQPEFNHGRVFWRGDFVAYSGTLPDPTRKRGFSKTVTDVWDVRNEREGWREEEAFFEAADDTHAYWFPESNVVARRVFIGKQKAEQCALPKETIRLAFDPPKLFALVKQDREWVLTLFDLKTGGRAEYDLRAPDRRQVTGVAGSGPNSWATVFLHPTDPDHRASLPIGIDAATGEVRVLHDKVVYKVPAAKRMKADAKPKWEPVPPAK